MKIKRFQGGGFATFTPIINAMPAPASSGASTSSAEETKGASSILNDDVFKELLKGDFLVNDANNLVSELVALEAGSPTPYTQSNTRSMAIRMIGKVNELKQNKNYWQDAINRAKENGGLGEVAVGTSGEVYTKDDKNNIKAISLSEYNKDKDEIKLLSVAELMNERQYTPTLTGKNSIFNVAENSVGLDKITNSIKDIVSMLGKETLKTEDYYTKEQAKKYLSEMGGKEPTASEQQGISLLNKIINSPGELAQVQSEDSSERKHLDKALNYIWDTLGSNKQQKLTATAVINGKKNPKEMILDMLVFGTDESKTLNVTPKAADIGSSKKAGGDKNEKSLTQFQLFHNDKLMQPNNTFAFNDPKMGTIFKGIIGGTSPIITPNGANIGMTTLKNILDSGYNAILKSDQIFFGDKKVTSTDLQNIIYDGQDAARVYMPVDPTDGSPDYKSLEHFKDVYAVYEANKDSWTSKRAESHFKENGFNINIDEKYEDGEKIKVIRDNARVKPFLVMYGYTNDATDLIGGNEKWLNKLSSSEEDSVMPWLDQIWTIKSGKTTKSIKPEKVFNIEEYWKGMVAIPYKKESASIVNSMVGQGPREVVTTIGDSQRNLAYSSNAPLNANVSASQLNK